MANLVYLLSAVAASGVVCVVLWLRNRKPSSTEHGIDSFQRELRALAPEPTPPDRQGPSAG